MKKEACRILTHVLRSEPPSAFHTVSQLFSLISKAGQYDSKKEYRIQSRCPEEDSNLRHLLHGNYSDEAHIFERDRLCQDSSYHRMQSRYTLRSVGCHGQ
jgi:hypothetical protein